MDKKPLPNVTVSSEIFNKILENKVTRIKCDSLSEYKCGYKEKNICYYTRNTLCDELIIQKYELNGILGKETSVDDYWKQILVTEQTEQSEEIIEKAIGPMYAVNYINKVLGKQYTKEEILDIYSQYTDSKNSPWHINPNTGIGRIVCLHNCQYVDANGAYASMLINMFPRSRKDLEYLFKHRHDNNNRYKNMFNYYVGMLTQNEKKRKIHERTIYPETRYWIVGQVTKMLTELISYMNPEFILYVNTDGCIIMNPENRIPNSDKVGEFKIEYEGDVYVYYGDNYYVMQYGDEKKGSLPLELRDMVDLTKGQVVTFDIKVEDGVKKYYNVKTKLIKE